MDAEDVHTYTNIKLMYNRRAHPSRIWCTLDELREMCTIMETLLPNTKLRVEAVGGGGILFTNRHYKSIRFHSDNFPWIQNPDKTKGTFSLTSKDSAIMHVTLKSFYDAEPFTREEVCAFQTALRRVLLEKMLRFDENANGWCFYKNIRVPQVR